MSKPESAPIRDQSDPRGGRLIVDEPADVERNPSETQPAFSASTLSTSKGTSSTSPANIHTILPKLGATANPPQPKSQERSSVSPPALPPPPSSSSIQGSYTSQFPRTTSDISAILEGRFNSRPPIARSMAALREESTPTNRISRAKKGKRVHACHHPGCEKIFTRAEHLRRHQLNHSTEVLYRCDMCDKTFVRQDLLSRHTERHASQARRAVQTLALAQRHRHFASHFGISVPMLTTPQSPPRTSDYGGNSHVFDANLHTNSRMNSGDPSIVPQIMGTNSPNQATQTASIVAHAVSSYAPSFQATSVPMSVTAESPLDFTSTCDSTPSPSGSLRRAHLPFHLQHNEPQRQPGQYLIPVTSHAESSRQQVTVSVDQQQVYSSSPRQIPTWENYVWLFDDSISDQVVMAMNQNQDPALVYIHPLEAAYYQSAGLVYDPSNNNLKGATPVFHPLQEPMRQQILMLLRDVELPYINAANTEDSSMQTYLRLYWTKFHPMFPILHRPTFAPSIQMVMLVVIVLAIGASFGDTDASNFGAAAFEKVKSWILNSDEFSAQSPNANSVYLQQIILLTDIFEKLRSQRAQIGNTQLDLMLLNSIRRSQSLAIDPLENFRRYQNGGVGFNLQNEWHAWVDLESRKRVALIFFLWDAQQATLFGRSMCQTAFDLRMQLPCEEFLWNADSPNDWMKGLEGQQEYPGFLEMLRIFLDIRRQPPALSPLSSMIVLHGLISIGLDLQRRSSPIAPNSEETAAKQAKLLRGFEVWRGQFEELLGQILVEPWFWRIMLMYHMAYIVLHTNIHSLLTAAGDRRLCGRNTNDYFRAKQDMQKWSNVTSAQVATWHSVRILIPYLRRSQLYHQELFVSWSAYVATLVCWAYGKLSPPFEEDPTENEVQFWGDPHQETNMYLHKMSPNSWERLGHVRGYKRRTGGLLAVVSSNMESTRWGLIKESYENLKRINTLRSGRGV